MGIIQMYRLHPQYYKHKLFTEQMVPETPTQIIELVINSSGSLYIFFM